MLTDLLPRLLKKVDIDQAVTFALLTKAWQAAAGIVTLLLVTIFFKPELQGYFYAFSSLLALQVFVELGLFIVVVSLTSHEWSKLSIDVDGDVVGEASALSRLASLAGFVAKWYTCVSLIFVLGVGVAGYFFLSQTPTSGMAWQLPWWSAVALAAIQLWLTPILSMLEGCNQIATLNRFRFVQATVESLTVWLLLLVGAGLWVVAALLAVKAVTTILFLISKYHRFFRSIFAAAGQERIRWREEVWPMQWRLAAQGSVNYLVYSLYTPVMFHFHGPTVAGQMGMTLQVASVVQTLALAWVQTKVPLFGMLVAKHDFAGLDRVWWRASKLSFGFTIVGSLIIWIALLVLGELNAEWAKRMLGPLPTALFLVAYGLTQIVSYQAAYLRAHAREPFVVLGVLTGLLTGSSVFLLGSRYGPIGAAAAYAIVMGFFVVPMSTFIWIRRRAEWQNQSNLIKN